MREIAWSIMLALGLASVTTSAQVLTDCSAEGLTAALAPNGAFVVLQNCTITLSSNIVISGSVSLVAGGTNSTLTASSSNRFFRVLPNASLTLSGITLTGGGAENGAAVYVEAGAQATFSNCVFGANTALGRSAADGAKGSDSSGIGGDGHSGGNGTPGLGGAIFNLGDVSALVCRFMGNRAVGGSGGLGGDGGAGRYQGGDGGRGGSGATARGGAIYNLGNLSVINSSLEGNLVLGGNGALGGETGEGPSGGMIGSGGNGAKAMGAGIYNEGVARIVNCTFLTNTVTGGESAEEGAVNGGLQGGDGDNGGGGFGGALCNMNSMFTTNCTLVSNRAVGGRGANGGDGRYEAGDGGDGGEGYGGGIYNNGVQWLINCTLSQNSVTGGTNGSPGELPVAGSNGRRGPTLGGGIATTSAGQFNLLNSIVNGSTGAPNGSGPFRDLGNTISSDGSIATAAGSLKNRSALLAPYTTNGGPTLTMALQVGSPAAQAGSLQGAPNFDQRGFPRPEASSARSDIGALEMQAPVITNQPASQLVAPGGTATFTVGASGDRPFVYNWFRNGTNISGATGATLILTNATAALATGYIVTISNAVGRAQSQQAFLTVGIAPVITNQPISQTVAVGANVSFSAGATGAPPLSIQWRSNGVAVSTWTNWTLLLNNVQPSYTADYSARVTNSYAAVTSSLARLRVIGEPALSPSVNAGGTNFAFNFLTLTGLTYVTEFKNTLETPIWTPLLTNAGTGLSLTNLDPLTNLPSRFYRVRAQW